MSINNLRIRIKEKAHSKIRYLLLQFYHIITPNSICDIEKYNQLRKKNGMVVLTQGSYGAIQFKYRIITGLILFILIFSILVLFICFPKYYKKFTPQNGNVTNSITNQK